MLEGMILGLGNNVTDMILIHLVLQISCIKCKKCDLEKQSSIISTWAV